MIKGSVHEEHITIVNICAPNIGAPQYIRQALTVIKEKFDNNTIIAVDFNTPPAESATGGWVMPGLVFKWLPLCEFSLFDTPRFSSLVI